MLLVLTALMASTAKVSLAMPRLKVVATIWPLAMIVREVGGERVDVYSIVPVGLDPHTYSPKPGDILLVRSCDLFVTIGKEEFLGMFEKLNVPRIGWEDWVEAGLKLKDGNPHYIWLYPEDALKAASKIVERLSEIDPEGKDYYHKRLKMFSENISRIKTWAKTVLTGLNLVDPKVALAGSHFEPLFDFLNITVVAVLVKGGKAPGPIDVSDFQSTLSETRPAYVVVLATEKGSDEGRLALEVSRATGIPVLYLYAFPLDPSENYVEFYKSLTSMALAGLQMDIPESTGEGGLDVWLYTAIILFVLFLVFEGWFRRV